MAMSKHPTGALECICYHTMRDHIVAVCTAIIAGLPGLRKQLACAISNLPSGRYAIALQSRPDAYLMIDLQLPFLI